MRNLVLKLIQKHMLQVPSNIRAGDLVRHKPSGCIYEAVAYRYTFELQPRLFLQENGRLFEVIHLKDYERVTDPGVIANASY
jgi:hypothetical protein